uniref:MULE transposase domain-containing protein n=1 Tax=Romanomermis culicivorax TaxID=13658 RepID=A0A915J0F5_ROMCU
MFGSLLFDPADRRRMHFELTPVIPLLSSIPPNTKEYWIMDMCPSHSCKFRTTTYEQLFRCLINNLAIRFNDIGTLHTILMDFESAAMQAYRHLLPANINIRGCLFHFGQCLMHWLQSNGPKVAYEEENGQLSHRIHLIMACSMLPPNLVQNAWLQWLQRHMKIRSFAKN